METFSYYFSLEGIAFLELFKDPVWSALDRIQEYLAAIKGKILSPIPSHCFLENRKTIIIEENVHIESGCYIKGPCLIGAGSSIRHGAYIRGEVITGKNCIIGHATEIKRSILLNNVHAAHFAYIGDTILGNGVNLGAGVKCANFRLDGEEIFLSIKGKRLPSGCNKLGAIIGDGSSIGCNCVLCPGALLSKKVTSYPNLTLKGFIAADTFVKL